MTARPAALIPWLALLAIAALPACDAADSPTTSGADACRVDRDCQDGDLCNGLEACVVGHCRAAARAEPSAPAICAPSTAACGALCADDERCTEAVCDDERCTEPSCDDGRCTEGACVLACLPPLAPTLTVLPVGTRLAFPEGALVWLDEASAAVRPARPSDLGPDRSVTFTRPGKVTLEARWADPEPGCEASAFRMTYEVAGEASADPELAADAIALDDPRLTAWAAGWAAPAWGTDLAPEWQDLTRALGPATGAWDDATSLGNGGAITLIFETPFGDHPGPDLAVFENGFSESFLELAFVEVSSNGVDFARFPSLSTQSAAVGPYATLAAVEVMGLAGRFRGGFGTTFDLASLAQTSAVLTGRVDLSAIAYVRVVDVVGDGTSLDSFGRPVYDPTPTFVSAGFDLEAIGVLTP